MTSRMSDERLEEIRRAPLLIRGDVPDLIEEIDRLQALVEEPHRVEVCRVAFDVQVWAPARSHPDAARGDEEISGSLEFCRGYVRAREPYLSRIVRVCDGAIVVPLDSSIPDRAK